MHITSWQVRRLLRKRGWLQPLYGMKLHREAFESSGYLIVEGVLSETCVANISSLVKGLRIESAGTRNVLEYDWCRSVAEALRSHVEISPLLPPNPVAIQCIYFEKSKAQNWLVSLHRDSIFPIKARVESSEWGLWTQKEGKLYGRPPDRVLSSLVAIRLHLESNGEENGPLQVVPGSHSTDQNTERRISCLVQAGGAVILRPQLLHASSKARSGIRRVLHFVFGPEYLPDGAEWVNAV